MDKSRAKILAQTVGENLARIRKEKGYTRKDLADILNTGVFLIGSYERGQTLMPLDKIFNLADFFKISVTDLTGDTVYSDTPKTIGEIVSKKIFEYKLNRYFLMAEKLLGNILPIVQSDGTITVISPERIEYNNGDVTFLGKQNAINFKDAKDFVTAMELAESRALYEQISFNQAFRQLVFKK